MTEIADREGSENQMCPCCTIIRAGNVNYVKIHSEYAPCALIMISNMQTESHGAMEYLYASSFNLESQSTAVQPSLFTFALFFTMWLYSYFGLRLPLACAVSKHRNSTLSKLLFQLRSYNKHVTKESKRRQHPFFFWIIVFDLRNGNLQAYCP